MPNMSDIAKRAGVSTATVSRTFSASSKISAETRDRVMKAAEHLDYRPRHADIPKEKGRGRFAPLPPASATTIGFQFFASQALDNLLVNTFYTSILAGAQAESQRMGMNLLLHSTDRSGLYHQPPKILSDASIGGILLVGTASPNVVETFAGHVSNIVLIDNRDTTGRYTHFVADDFGGGYAATRYLIGLGHTRIAFYAPEPSVPTFEQRRHGYVCALFDAGLTPDPGLIFDATSSDYEALKTHFAADLTAPRAAGRPTAVFAANDFYAAVVTATLRDLGLSLPADLSLVGFDDLPSSRHAHPPLTTVQVDTQALGRQAVQCLHNLIRRSEAEQSAAHPERHELSVRLIVRGSCHPL